MSPEHNIRTTTRARARVDPATPAAPAAGALSSAPDGVLSHPRTISWVGASALALGGSNQSLFLIGALLVAQGTMAIPLLALGLVLSYMATPGWIELSCMFPNRVGGIAATCAEAFRPYSAVLANLTGVCYWWGWVPTCGLTAIVSAQAIHQWYLPHTSVKLVATLIVVAFTAVNLCGLKWAVRVAKPIAGIAFLLALCSGLIPVFFGHVDWHRALDFHLNSPFGGAFGHLTSVMTGLYLIGFAAPALEAAACHIGEMKNPAVDQPKAMWSSGGMASVFFVLLPVVWLGMFTAGPLEGNLAGVIGPTFTPVLGSLTKAAAVGFVVFNMSCGTLQPLSGASRTLSQLSEDGLLPRIVGFRSRRTDAPVIAILVTASASVIFLLAGDPISLVAAANLTYLIGIALPSIAVWLLRRNEPNRPRTYRARDSSILLGMIAAVVWLLATILGFAQFGLPIVTFGLALAFSGSLAYAWRAHGDRRRSGGRVPGRSIYLKLTGAMLLVLVLDAVGYLVTVKLVGSGNDALMAVLKDIFVVIGLLTISVGLILPGMIAHSISQMEDDALDLAKGTLTQLTTAREAMAGDSVDGMRCPATSRPVTARTAGKSTPAAASFNKMRSEMVQAGRALDEAVGELTSERGELAHLVEERTAALIAAQGEIEHAQRRRQDMHERLHVLSWRLSATDIERADLPSALAEIASIVGRVLDVDVVAIYAVSVIGEFADLPVLWHPDRIEGENDGLLTLTPDSRRFLDGVAAHTGTLSLPGVSDFNRTATGDDKPLFLVDTGYAAWVLSPVHAADGQLLALLAIGMIDPDVEWNKDDVALIDSVGADVGQVIVQAQLFQRQLDLVRQLQDLDRAKSEFLATFSHELRTPLTSIRAYTELLREDDDTDGSQDRILEVIQQNSVRLSVLIEDILTLSHLNSAVYDIPMVPVDVVPLIDSVSRSLAPIAEANDLTTTTRISQDSAFVLGNQDQLERLLLNLVTNAIKFTPPCGHIVISISGSASSVVISVSDNGIGIPVAEQEAVFGRFFRGAEAKQEVIPGSGLGLAIVQAIVEHHGGTLSLDSVPGRGTTVWVRLPSLVAAQTRHELEAQGGAPPADTEVEDRMSVGVGSFRRGSDVPALTPKSEAHTEELQS
jgi:signal transduction histidine kinase/amino acid transporter